MKPIRLEIIEQNDPMAAEKNKTLIIHVDCARATTVKDAQNLKTELEKALTALVQNFEERTGLTVTEVTPFHEGRFWRTLVRLP